MARQNKPVKTKYPSVFSVIMDDGSENFIVRLATKVQGIAIKILLNFIVVNLQNLQVIN